MKLLIALFASVAIADAAFNLHNALCTTFEPGFEMPAGSMTTLPRPGEPVVLQRGNTVGFNADLRSLIFDGAGSQQTVLSDPLSEHGVASVLGSVHLPASFSTPHNFWLANTELGFNRFPLDGRATLSGARWRMRHGAGPRDDRAGAHELRRSHLPCSSIGQRHEPV